MQEQWKDIEEYEGLYQVSTLGRVKSLERIDSNNHVVRERILKPNALSNGYHRYTLSCNGVKSHGAHRLVAQAFLDNPNDLPQVHHINHKRDDNRVENLMWVNQSEQYDECWKEKMKDVPTRGVVCILNGVRYDSQTDASMATGINQDTISLALKRKQKKVKGFVITYESN